MLFFRTYYLSKKNAHNCFLNIANTQKYFLSSKSAWFMNDHVTLKTGVMVLKIQLCSQKYITF